MEITLTANQHRYYGNIVEKMNRLKGETMSIFIFAKANKPTSDFILDWFTSRVRQNKMYLQLPSKYRQEIEQYFFACSDMFRLYEIEWALWYDGQFMGNKKESDKMYKIAGFDNNKVKGHHVYKNTKKIFF